MYAFKLSLFSKTPITVEGGKGIKLIVSFSSNRIFDELKFFSRNKPGGGGGQTKGSDPSGFRCIFFNNSNEQEGIMDREKRVDCSTFVPNSAAQSTLRMYLVF